MSWKEKSKEWGGGDFTFLSNDGECLVFVVADEPYLLEGKFQGKKQERIGCPIVTDEGFVLLVTGKRVFRKLAKFESRFKNTAFIVTRHGGEGDINAKYDVGIFGGEEKTDQLLAIRKKEYKTELLEQALLDVKNIMNG